jgi:hypothetical protein
MNLIGNEQLGVSEKIHRLTSGFKMFPGPVRTTAFAMIDCGRCEKFRKNFSQSQHDLD